jgi:hypothetical protein
LHGVARFQFPHFRFSLQISLNQLGVEAVELLLLFKHTSTDWIDPELELTLQEFQQSGLIGGHGLSGAWPDL